MLQMILISMPAPPKASALAGLNGQVSPTLCGDELDSVGLDPDSLRTYDSDSLWSYEGGVKVATCR